MTDSYSYFWCRLLLSHHENLFNPFLPLGPTHQCSIVANPEILYLPPSTASPLDLFLFQIYHSTPDHSPYERALIRVHLSGMSPPICPSIQTYLLCIVYYTFIGTPCSRSITRNDCYSVSMPIYTFPIHLYIAVSFAMDWSYS